MKLLSSNENRLLKISRTIGDLRLGMPIVYRGHILLSVETMNKKVFESLSNLDVILIVPSCKIEGEHREEGIMSFDFKNKSFAEAQEVCSDKKLDASILNEAEFDNNIAHEGMRIIKATELLPIILMYKIRNNSLDIDNISILREGRCRELH